MFSGLSKRGIGTCLEAYTSISTFVFIQASNPAPVPQSFGPLLLQRA